MLPTPANVVQSLVDTASSRMVLGVNINREEDEEARRYYEDSVDEMSVCISTHARCTIDRIAKKTSEGRIRLCSVGEGETTSRAHFTDQR